MTDIKFDQTSSFLDNLGSDWVAVDPNGHILSRASTEDAVRRAAPNATVFLDARGIKDLGKPKDEPKSAPPDSADPVGFSAESLNADKAETDKAETDKAETDKAGEPTRDPLDHDGNGKKGGAKKPA